MNATEESIFKILFPPNGDVPTRYLDAAPRMRVIMKELIALSCGEAIPQNVGRRITRPSESRAITQQIVELHQRGMSWNKISESLGLGISSNACRKRYADWLTAQNGQIPQETETVAEPGGLQEAEEPQVETIPISESQITERIDEVAEPVALSQKPATLRNAVFEVQLATEDDLDGERITTLRAQGKDAKEIAAILSSELPGKEASWKTVRAKLAHMARMRKGGAAAPEEAAAEKPQNDNAPGTPAAREEASPGGEPPQKAKYPDPKPISRAALEAMMLELHRQGMDPEEISEELHRQGYSRGPGTVRSWLRRLGVEV